MFEIKNIETHFSRDTVPLEPQAKQVNILPTGHYTLYSQLKAPHKHLTNSKCKSLPGDYTMVTAQNYWTEQKRV